MCLDSVSKAIEDLEAEIIVVDNHSEDESVDLVRRLYPNVNVISNEDNYGFSKGNNIGVQQAKGEYLCILNPDTIVSEDTFKVLLANYNQLEEPGAIGVQLIDGTGQYLEESKRNIPTPKVALNKLAGYSKSYYNYNLGKDSIGPTDILVGAFMFMKTELYREIGGFDEDYFMYGEDIDLSFRIIKAGYQNYYYGNTKVLHFKGESTTKDEVYLNRFFNAMLIFYKKHFKNYKTSFKVVKQILKLTQRIERIKLKSLKHRGYLKHEVVILSPNLELQKKIKTKLKIPISTSKELTSNFKNTCLIFDTENIEIKTCLEIMINQQFCNNSFRFKPRTHNFIIGSESKELKGEVLKLNEQVENIEI